MLSDRTQLAPSEGVEISPGEGVEISPSEDVVRFILEQLDVACGQTQDCLTAAQRDSVLLLLTLVLTVSNKESGSGTHSTGTQRQEARGYLVCIVTYINVFKGT